MIKFGDGRGILSASFEGIGVLVFRSATFCPFLMHTHHRVMDRVCDLFSLIPCLVRVEVLHGRRPFCRVRSQVFLIHHAFVVNDKSLHT